MAQPNQGNAARPVQKPNNESKKRKEHPSNLRTDTSKRAKTDHRAKQRDARKLSAQSTSSAFKNGELDVHKFVQSREYEIRALEEGISRSKMALTKRAFQQVPKELRRRTASHNAKRVPKRLQGRAKREADQKKMVEDNTPTVTARRRKPTRHMRLRLETAQHLRALGVQKKTTKAKDVSGDREGAIEKATDSSAIKTRAPRIKSASLATPPLPNAKFRKRQKCKTWLPTHMFHAKRARMTPPKEPLWRFAISLTPTAKSYRPTHRATQERGAVAWDVSYMSTICLEGQQRSIHGMLRALGGDSRSGTEPWGSKGVKWRTGTRVWEGFLFQHQEPHLPIAPVTLIWCVASSDANLTKTGDSEQQRRSVFIRVHPSAFLQLWAELVRLAKVAKPQVSIQDLRFEIGSIEAAGPSATEALHGALYPSSQPDESQASNTTAEATWATLLGLPHHSVLPPDVLLAFDVQDPRLRHPPRKAALPSGPNSQEQLMEMLVKWPLDQKQQAASIFDRKSRLAASSSLSSQKAINRRKALATPGEYPSPIARDPRIPVLLFCRSWPDKRHATWTLLAPWKCIQPIWYSVMHTPLSVGGQPRFGGLDEKRQLCFENGVPWFPGDYVGTKAGWEWELEQRKIRESEWRRRPKSKRVNWDTVDLGAGQKGEIGAGWSCDWERLLAGALKHQGAVPTEGSRETTMDGGATTSNTSPPNLIHLPFELAQKHLKEATPASPPSGQHAVATVRINLLARGVPQACARIYRLPSAATSKSLRNKWLALLHHNAAQRKQRSTKDGLPRLPKDAPAHVIRQRLAQSLLEPTKVGDDDYPPCPGEEDLIGFVTSGNYNLSEGQGFGIANVSLSKAKEALLADPSLGHVCVVRNAGNGAGRLAQWEIV